MAGTRAGALKGWDKRGRGVHRNVAKMRAYRGLRSRGISRRGSRSLASSNTPGAQGRARIRAARTAFPRARVGPRRYRAVNVNRSNHRITRGRGY